MTPAARLMVARLTELAAQGKSYAEAAWEIDAPYRYVAHFAKKHDIAFKLERRGPKPREDRQVAA